MTEIETCFSCKLKHPSVEATGIWHCPNALCRGCGAAWFRRTLDSYKDEMDGTHTVDDKEWIEKGRIYNKEKKIRRKNWKRKYIKIS